MSGRSNKKRKFATSLYGYVSGQTSKDAQTLLNAIESKDNAISSQAVTISSQTGTISRQTDTILTQKDAIGKLHVELAKKNDEHAKEREAHIASDSKLRRELEKHNQWRKKAHKMRDTAQKNTRNAITAITTEIVAEYKVKLAKKNDEHAKEREVHIASVSKLRRELEKHNQWRKKAQKMRDTAQKNAKNAIKAITTEIMAANERNPESLGFLTHIHQELVDVLTDAQFQIITLEGIKEKSITCDQLLKVATVEICQLKQTCTDLKDENNMFKDAFSAHSAASALVVRRLHNVERLGNVD